MNQREAEIVLTLHPPYTQDEVVRAWHDAMTRARAEALNSLAGRKAFPEKLKRIKEAKRFCETLAATVISPQSTTPVAPAPATPAYSSTPTSSTRQTPTFRRARVRRTRKGTPFSAPGQPAWSNVQPRNYFRYAVVTSIALTMVTSLGGLLQYFNSSQTRANSIPNSVPTSQNRYGSGVEQVSKSGPPKAITHEKTTTPSKAIVAKATIKILSYPWSEVHLIKLTSQKEFSFTAPMRFPESISPGVYEARVLKGEQKRRIKILEIRPGHNYELRIRLDQGNYELIEKEMGK